MSFFNKLKGDLGIEAQNETAVKKVTSQKLSEKKIQKTDNKPSPQIKKKEEETSGSEKKWSESEGQLAVDVYETPEHFVIQSTIAGVKGSNLDINIEKDIVTIRGKRENIARDEEKKYLYQECYWGNFSREIILPEKVDASQAKAVLKDGILTLKIPKLSEEKGEKIIVEEE